MSCRGRKKSLIFAYRVPEIATGGNVSSWFWKVWRVAKAGERLVGGQDRTGQTGTGTGTGTGISGISHTDGWLAGWRPFYPYRLLEARRGRTY